MESYYWDNKIDYLSKTRWLYVNDDYLEFLVKSVWAIKSPFRVIDFGCGYGYLGTKLMPLFPKGSSYTGVDSGRKLIEHAQHLFQNAPFRAEFYQGDIQTMEFERKYDVVVCHAFLLHVANPKAILKKMIDCLVDGGRIICFEPHWISAMANYYLDGYESTEFVQLEFLQELFDEDARRSGKDGNIGMKLPIYLSQLGVTKVDCRISDRVNVLEPNGDSADRDVLYQSLKTDGFGAYPGDEESFVANLVNRGAAIEEAHKQYRNELLLSKLFSPDAFLTYAPNMKITSGIVGRS